MKKLIYLIATVAVALLSFASCQKPEVIQIDQEQKLYYVTFTAEEPETKTTVEQAEDGEGNKYAKYSWTSNDTDSDRWVVYCNNTAASTVTPSLDLLANKLTITAGFAVEPTAGDKFVALFNKGVSAVQNITSESVFDPTSDVMISLPIEYDSEASSYSFRFTRLGAVAQATVKGISNMTSLKSAKVIAQEGVVLAADYDYVNRCFEQTGSSKIIVNDIDADLTSGNAVFHFITVPQEDVANVKMLVTTKDNESAEHLFVKQFGRPISFSKGNVFAFNVSGFTEVTTKANFNVNGEVTSQIVYQGEPIEFPEAPATIAGYDFVGWSTSSISGTQAESPELVDPSTTVMGDASVTYYAVYAKASYDDITEELTNAEVNSLSASEALAYNTEKTYTDGTINYSIYAYTDQANRKWIQVKKDQGVYVKISAPSAIKNVSVTLTSPTNSSGGINDITKHTAYSGTVGLTASDCTYSSSSESLAKTDEITDNVATMNLSGTEKDVYLKVSTGARIWSISVSYARDTPSYSDYCTSVETREATSLSWSAASYTVRTDETPSYPTLTTSPVGLAGVTYDSSNKAVATIDAAGAITQLAPGTTTITASFAGNSTYQPAVDASYELTITAAVQKHTLHFSINEVLDAGILVAEGDPINFPEDPSIDGVLFLGWVKEALDAPQQTAPTCVVTAEEKMGTDDVTYYAVFYKRSGSAPSEELAQTLQYDTWSYSGSTTDKSSYRLFHSGSYIESDVFDRSKLTKVVVYGGTFGGDSYNKLTIGDGTNTWKSVTVSGSSQTGVNTYTNGTALSGTGKLRITSNSGSASSNGVRISKVEIFVMTGGYVYSDYCTTVITLRSIAISGSVTKTIYDAGDVLDPTGLTVTATYSNNSNADVTSSVEWSFSPATLPAGDNQSCTATATYGGKLASKEVTGLTVNAAVTLQSVTVSGTPTKKEYNAGDNFDPAGLIVTGKYSDNHQETITEGITWSEPAALTAGQTSVSITATVNGISSAEYTVTGLTVTAASKTYTHVFTSGASGTMSKNVQSYTDSFTNTSDGITTTVTNFNNNNRGWNYVKCGSKSAASTATIVTTSAITEAIKRVKLTIDATTNNVSSVKLIIASNSSFTTNKEEYSFTNSNGVQVVTITTPKANYYYKIEVVCNKASSNGFFQTSKIIYTTTSAD